MNRNGRCARAAAGVLLGLSCAASLLGITLARGPYLGRPDDVSVAVVWLTDLASSSRVDYASDDGVWVTVSNPDPVTRHVVRLTDLVSGAFYRYRVSSDDAPMGPESTFRAPRAPAESSFRFGVIGDTAGVVIPSEIAPSLLAEDVDLVIHTGDVVYPSGEQSRYDGEYFRPLAPLIASVPVLPTIGNHDAKTGHAAPYLSNFVLPKNSATGESRFYALRQGSALFVSVDVETSEFGAGSAQYAWLEQTLRSTDAPWKFVYLHEPPYCSGDSNLVVRLILSPLFESAGVDVVFAGHVHLYERTFPIRDFVESGPGVLYLTEGGGGATLVGFQRESFSAEVAERFGYVVAEIAGETLTLTAHDPGGAVFDSVTVEKRPQPGARMPPKAAARGSRLTASVPDR